MINHKQPLTQTFFVPFRLIAEAAHIRAEKQRRAEQRHRAVQQQAALRRAAADQHTAGRQ